MRGVERLTALGHEHGWKVVQAATDDAVVLHLQRGGRVLLALWENGAWRAGIALARADVGRLGARELAELVRTAGDLEDEMDALCAAKWAARDERARVAREKKEAQG